MPSESPSQLLINGRLVELRAASESAPVVATSEAASTQGNATSVTSSEGNVEPPVANELGTLHEPYEAGIRGDGNSAGSAGVGSEDPLLAVPPAPASQEPPCMDICRDCFNRPCCLGQHKARGDVERCLCEVCTRPCPQQGDIVAALAAFKEWLRGSNSGISDAALGTLHEEGEAVGVVENADLGPPQVQGHAAVPCALGTQHETSGPIMFEVGPSPCSPGLRWGPARWRLRCGRLCCRPRGESGRTGMKC